MSTNHTYCLLCIENGCHIRVCSLFQVVIYISTVYVGLRALSTSTRLAGNQLILRKDLLVYDTSLADH